MFTLASQCIVRWPVDIALPADGDAQVTAQIRVSYRLPRHSETLEYLRAIDALAAREAAGERVTVDLIALDDGRLRAHVVGWDDVIDESGAPVVFSPESLEAVIDIPWVRTALLSGLRDAVSGAREKN